MHKSFTPQIMPITDCNNYVKSTAEFFSESCAVNTLLDRYNPLGDNSNKLCELCGSHDPGVRCTIKDPYAGFHGAIKCLMDRGDIAFVKFDTVQSMGLNTGDFELLCLDGSRAELADYKNCNWGVAPGHFVIVSSAMELSERFQVQKFLIKLVEKYGKQSVPQFQNLNLGQIGETAIDPVVDDNLVDGNLAFDITESQIYGNIPNLMFNDELRSLAPIPAAEQLYKSVLQKNYGESEISPEKTINGIRSCGISQMRLCVTSEPELLKCQRMSTALSAQLLKPRMTCVPLSDRMSHQRCMQMISRGQADVAMFEAGDIMRAGRRWGLVPIMAEVYNLGTPDYYAVAVVKIADNSSELIYLKRKNSCHTGLGQVKILWKKHHVSNEITLSVGSWLDHPYVVVDQQRESP